MKLKELLPIIPLRQDFLKMFLLSVAADGATVYSPCVKSTTETPDALLQDLIQTPDSNRAVFDITMSADPVGTRRHVICDQDLNVVAVVLSDMPMFSSTVEWKLAFYWIEQPRGLIE